MINNIIFMGTPRFAVPSLLILIKNNLKPVLCVTQPDKLQGRNRHLDYSPIKKIALENNLPIYQPEDINSYESIVFLQAYHPDILITVGYGALLNSKLRSMCPFGAINLHPSLLPLHRGADPIRSTLINGEQDCGNTIFFINGKMDAGPIISQRKYRINSLLFQINFTNLENILADRGAQDLMDVILLLGKNELRFKALKTSFSPQNHLLATYSTKFEKHSSLADFRLTADKFIRLVVGFALEPGYYCYYRGKRLKIFLAEIFSRQQNIDLGVIKSIIKNQGFIISVPDADLLIKEVQYEGKKIMNAWDFCHGVRMKIGEYLSMN